MKLNLGLTDKQRKPVIQILHALLADEVVLYMKTRNYHWNVTGNDFGQLHQFFEGQYEQLDEIMDAVAERARALGGLALGSLREFVKISRLHEHVTEELSAHDMLASLLADHETVIRSLREDLDACATRHGDAGTGDFLTGLMEQHEKMAWMLRAHLT